MGPKLNRNAFEYFFFVHICMYLLCLSFTIFVQLSKTNFSNNNDFRALLQSLYATFKEFKMHEQIENEYIIGLLQQRSQTIYNVHSDNKLSEMLSLFEKGLKNVKVSCKNGYLLQLRPSSHMSLVRLFSIL